jgi:hypothetical protein
VREPNGSWICFHPGRMAGCQVNHPRLSIRFCRKARDRQGCAGGTRATRATPLAQGLPRVIGHCQRRILTVPRKSARGTTVSVAPANDHTSRELAGGRSADHDAATSRRCSSARGRFRARPGSGRSTQPGPHSPWSSPARSVGRRCDHRGRRRPLRPARRLVDPARPGHHHRGSRRRHGQSRAGYRSGPGDAQRVGDAAGTGHLRGGLRDGPQLHGRAAGRRGAPHQHLGILAFASGRGLHGVLALLPMLLGAALGAGAGRRIDGGGRAARGWWGRVGLWSRRGVTAMVTVALLVLTGAVLRPASTAPIRAAGGKPLAASRWRAASPS